MLSIRLSRVGKKNKPTYRFVIMEKGRDPYGRALEILGSYNPHSKDLQVKGERINYWISKGAQMSPTVNNLLVAKGIVKGDKVKASKSGKKKGEEAAAASAEAKPAEVKPAETAATPAEVKVEEPSPVAAEPEAKEAPVAEEVKTEPSSAEATEDKEAK